MTITKTVDIPSSRLINVPDEVPLGRTIIAFTPASAGKEQIQRSEARDIELFRLHADELNAEAMDVLSYQIPIFEEDDP